MNTILSTDRSFRKVQLLATVGGIDGTIISSPGSVIYTVPVGKTLFVAGGYARFTVLTGFTSGGCECSFTDSTGSIICAGPNPPDLRINNTSQNVGLVPYTSIQFSGGDSVYTQLTSACVATTATIEFGLLGYLI